MVELDVHARIWVVIPASGALVVAVQEVPLLPHAFFHRIAGQAESAVPAVFHRTGHRSRRQGMEGKVARFRTPIIIAGLVCAVGIFIGIGRNPVRTAVAAHGPGNVFHAMFPRRCRIHIRLIGKIAPYPERPFGRAVGGSVNGPCLHTGPHHRVVEADELPRRFTGLVAGAGRRQEQQRQSVYELSVFH